MKKEKGDFMIDEESYDIGYMAGWKDRQIADVDKIVDKMIEIKDIDILEILQELIEELEKLK